MMVVASPDGFFVEFNDALPRTLGFSAQQLHEMPLLSFVHPDDTAATRQCFESVLAGSEVIDFENRFRTVGGEYRWFSWRARCAPETRDTYCVYRDVTNSRASNRLIEQQRNLKERHASLMSRISAGMAHDFQNVLASIQLNAELVRRKTGDEHADAILEAVDRGAQILEQHRYLYKRPEPRPKTVSLRNLLHDVVGTLRRELPARLQIEFMQDETTSLSILADEAQAYRSFLSLLQHVVQAAGPAPGTIQISTGYALEAPADLQMLSGASAGHVEIVIQLVGHEAGATEAVGFDGPELGRDLNRGIAESIVEDHEGILSADVSSDRIRYEVLWPEATEAAHQAEKSERLPRSIAVVDDDPLICKALRSALRLNGHSVETFTDPLDFLKIVTNGGSYDVLVLDYVMPEIDGLTLLERVWNIKRFPVVMLTGNTHELRLRRRRLPSPIDVLAKPVAINELCDAIERAHIK